MPVAQARLQILQVCKLLQCVRSRDKEQIEKLIAKGTPHLINYNASEQGLTALIVAAKANDEDMVGFLLGLGAHPDVVDLQGKTPAMWAAEFGNVECLEKLLHAGADMTIRDIEGKGIIFYLLTPTERHLKCLDLSLTHGADVNSISLDGNPVFVEACNLAVDNEKLCLQLLAHGSDPNAVALKSGRTPLMAAASSGGIKVVAALLAAGANPNVIDSKKCCAAHFAAMNGHIKALQLMAGYGADFNKVANDGGNPIHYAAKSGEAQCIKFLSQRGCNPKIKNNHGMLPKVIAKEAGNKAAGTELRKAEKAFGKGGKNNDPWVLQFYDWAQARKSLLISAFQVIDVEDVGKVSTSDFIDVMTAKNCPADEEHLRTVISLQDKNKEGRIDYNDFFVAKKWVNKNFVYEAFEGKKKKKKGKRKGGKKGKFKLVMPICIQDEGPRQFGGAPPLVYIPQHIHYTDTGRFDRDKPPKHPLQDDSAWYIESPLRSYVNINDAVKNGDIASLRDALKQGVPVDTRDKFYKTPLMIACYIANIDLVRFLLENGANVNARDNFKWTPLHHACHVGQLDIVQLLLENGAEIDATSINGGTPLTRAIECSKDTVVQYLIERGCKVQTENKKGLTPMDLAYSWADPRVFDIVQTKWDTLKPKDDKKNKKPKPNKKGEKKEAAEPKPEPVKLPDEDTLPLPRRGSILRAASALAGGLEVHEDIRYVPKKVWTKQKTTNDLLRDKEIKRDRFGWEVDFPDYETPFQKNISTKLQEIAAEDAQKD